MIIKLYNVITRLIDTLWFHNYFLYRDIKYSLVNRGQEDLLNRLLVAGHIIEKGLTMPNSRLGFGQGVVLLMISLCKKCINLYGADSDQVQYALDDLREYKERHKKNNYELPSKIMEGVNSLLKYQTTESIDCKEYTQDSFFCEYKNFEEFAFSRHTCRYFSKEDVPEEVIHKAVSLAQTAPSACNRQSTRIIVASGEIKNKLLKIQNGHRGFGENINKMIVITAEQSCWDYNYRTSAYLDAGIFVMNLLYSLHFYKICACTLNAHLTIKEQSQVRNILGMKDSEIPVCFIAIGMPIDKMMIAKSRRLQTDKILKFV